MTAPEPQPAAPAPSPVETRIDEAVAEIYAAAAKATDACGLVVDRERLPSILLEIAARSAARMIAAAASEKEHPQKFRASILMLFMDKVAMHSGRELQTLLTTPVKKAIEL